MDIQISKQDTLKDRKYLDLYNAGTETDGHLVISAGGY